MRPPLVVALIALALALLAPAAASGARGPVRCNGAAALCDRPLDRVVLPATHNAMSAASLGWQLPNQPLPIPAQLRAGIRGLLLDTYYGVPQLDGTVATSPVPTPSSRLYLCHVDCRLGATPLIDVLRSMRTFLRSDPDNVLVIVNEDHVAPRAFAREVTRSGLGRHLYRGRPGPRWPTLGTMIARRQQVVMLAERDAGGVPWYHEAYEGIVQETPYSFAQPSLLTDSSNWAASCRPNRGGRRGSLFLMNHWAPPIAPRPATSARVNAARVLVGRARACARRRGRLPSLVAVDMFRSGALLPAVRALNGLSAPTPAG